MSVRLFKNASSSVIQFVVSSVVLIFLYRFLFRTIGPGDLGVWSLIMGMSSLTQVAGLGLAGGAVKFVAAYRAKGDEKRVAQIIQTSLLSVGAMVGLVLFIGYPWLRIFFMNAVGPANADKVAMLFPYGMLCLWLMVLVNVVYASLDGYQKMYLHSFVFMWSSVLNLFLCFWIVPHFHLLGLAILGLVQNTLLLFVGWFFLKRSNIHLPLLPCSWNYGVCREVLGYSVKLQFISLTVILCEPTTKYLLTTFAGVASVGYYEMASRLAGQVRGFIVSANWAVVPEIADQIETNPGMVRVLYVKSVQFLAFLTFPIYSMLILAAPIISRVWLGELNGLFIFALTVLLSAHLINLFSNPAYFANIGTGHLNANLVMHIVAAFLNFVLGFFLGKFVGGGGVILAWGLALAIQSLGVFLTYNITHKYTAVEIFSSDVRILMVRSLMAFCLCFIGSLVLSYYTGELWGRGAALMFMAIASLWITLKSSMWQRVSGWVLNRGGA